MLPILLGRRARHLAADLQLLDEIRSALSIVATRRPVATTREPARGTARMPKRAVVTSRSR